MNYKLSCDCGRKLDVRASDAGSSVACPCGARVAVPSLSALRATIRTEDVEPETATSGASDVKTDLVFVFVVLLITTALGVVFTPALALAGLLMFFFARLWFAAQILREMAFPNAMMVFFVPFMPTLFLFKRFDVAWKPFFLGSVGFAAIIVGIASTSP